MGRNGKTVAAKLLSDFSGGGIGVKWSGNGGLAGHGQPKLEGMGKFYLALLQKARAALGGEDGQQLRWVANVIRLQA